MRKEIIQDIYNNAIDIQNLIKTYEDSILNHNDYKTIEQDLNRLCKSLKKKSNKLCINNYNKLKKENKYLGFPEDCSLPFFAYGIFKPGQLAYSRIREYCIEDELKSARAPHELYERDGIPFICKKESENKTCGYLIKFNENDSKNAYEIIRKTESPTFYEWGTCHINDEKCNILFGINTDKSRPRRNHDNSYNGYWDPFFKNALNIIANEMKDYKKTRPMDPVENLLKLQRNYMLLWASIERYTSLKYGENSKRYNNEQLAGELAFQNALKEYVNDYDDRIVFDSQSHNEIHLNPKNPVDSIEYYYTMRSNIVHRGKSVIPTDEKFLRKSLVELLSIFQHVLKNTFENLNFIKVPIDVGENEKSEE